MAAIRLVTHRVEKPWGRRRLWHGFEDVPPGGAPVGEIWFQHPGGEEPELLVKYLFTSDRLSIQVHPDDAAARAAGYPRGKDEAWLVLAAEPGATIALGTREVMSREALRAAALDGTIEHHMDWKSIRAGDFFYSPAGTVHAIGHGLTLVEIQQNVDLTYRLYDYGRPRELHLDEGVKVSNPVPFVAAQLPHPEGPGRRILAEEAKFVLERWQDHGGRLEASADRPVWLVPLAGGGSADGETVRAGEVWMLDAPADVAVEKDSDWLIAYPGETVLG